MNIKKKLINAIRNAANILSNINGRLTTQAQDYADLPDLLGSILTAINSKLTSTTLSTLDSIEGWLTTNLADINAQLTAKGSTAADTYSELPTKIEAIKPYDDSELVGLIANDLTELTNENVVTVGRGAFYYSYIKTVNFPNCTTIDQHAFNSSSVTSVNCPKLTTIRSYAFNEFKGATFSFEKVNYIATNAFASSNLTQITIPNDTEFSSGVFINNTRMTFADYQNQSQPLTNNIHNNNSRLTVLVLRRTDGITPLAGVSAFDRTPFRNGTGGTAYGPRALVSQYEQATNWSALESCTFAAIEDNIETLEALGLNVDEFKGAAE